MFSQRVSVFVSGICVGLVANCFCLSGAAAAMFASPVPIGPRVAIPDWSADKAIEVNTEVYKNLFVGDTWSSTSTLIVPGSMLVEGGNEGVTDQGEEFNLQAFVVDEFDLSELTASLSEEEQSLWASGGVRAAIFYGLIGSEATGYGLVYPVLDYAYSSDNSPGVHLVIVEIMDSSITESLDLLWKLRSWGLLQNPESASGDWEYWFNPCVDFDFLSTEVNLVLGDPSCEDLYQKCGDEYDSNMRIAVAAYKVVWATAGTGCIVGGILFGSFCLVGNPLACAAFSWGASRCGAILGGATAAMATAALASHIAYLDCIGDCGFDAGCP